MVILGKYCFCLHTLQSPEFSRKGVDTVGLAFDNKGNHSHRTVVKRQTLATQHQVGVIRNDCVDFRRLTTV